MEGEVLGEFFHVLDQVGFLFGFGGGGGAD